MQQQKHPFESRSLKRHLPEEDESRITGRAFRLAGFTFGVLNLCSEIEFPHPPDVETGNDLLLYCNSYQFLKKEK